MMRSLWSGVSGLQAHQVAMDVIGNNIANVNTYGFKYSRTDFADMLSQNATVATAPQGSLGGKNASQIGLGVTIASVEHIFTQGSMQNTGVNTDMAIAGSGFFVVSPNKGTDNFYTRAGNFVFDASGNYVDASGLAVQGWVRNATTNTVDTTGPITSIQIAPGMTMPARATTTVGLSANLTSGLTTTEKAATYPLTSNSTTNATTYNNTFEDVGVLFNANGSAFNLQTGQGVWAAFSTTTMNSAATGSSMSVSNVPAASTTTSSVALTLNGTSINGTLPLGLSAGTKASQLMQMINQYTSTTGVVASVSGTSITLTNNNALPGNSTKNISLLVNVADTTGLSTGGVTKSIVTAYQYTYTSGSPSPTPNSTSINQSPKQFHTVEDLRRFLQWQANDSASGGAFGSQISVNAQGQYALTNTNTNSAATGHVPHTLNMAVTSVSNSVIQAATLFTQALSAMSGSMPPSGTGVITSQAMDAATHAASTDVYDSLGSKHTLTFNYRKTANSVWSWTGTVPQPGAFTGTSSLTPNVYTSQNAKVMFNPDGSLLNVTPQTLTITFNNGSTANQQISLGWGTPGLFNGLTSYDGPSTTNSISQDGYTGGNLQGIAIDQIGALIGTFSNGQSIALAQVALSTFANPTGMMDIGGNNFAASANSGSPSVGVAGTGGRGTIQSGELEMSNVDLSGQLTEMIVIQRGFQANSKTITTSDQMIQTLLQLKQ